MGLTRGSHLLLLALLDRLRLGLCAGIDASISMRFTRGLDPTCTLKKRARPPLRAHPLDRTATTRIVARPQPKQVANQPSSSSSLPSSSSDSSSDSSSTTLALRIVFSFLAGAAAAAGASSSSLLSSVRAGVKCPYWHPIDELSRNAPKTGWDERVAERESRVYTNHRVPSGPAWPRPSPSSPAEVIAAERQGNMEGAGEGMWIQRRCV